MCHRLLDFLGFFITLEQKVCVCLQKHCFPGGIWLSLFFLPEDGWTRGKRSHIHLNNLYFRVRADQPSQISCGVVTLAISFDILQITRRFLRTVLNEPCLCMLVSFTFTVFSNWLDCSTFIGSYLTHYPVCEFMCPL
uniref:Putative secreted protein n=1 Tax=Rhipicephalus microplus TaxID=6941 RepID=A0A6G5A3P0_RHIMP